MHVHTILMYSNQIWYGNPSREDGTVLEFWSALAHWTFSMLAHSYQCIMLKVETAIGWWLSPKFAAVTGDYTGTSANWHMKAHQYVITLVKTLHFTLCTILEFWTTLTQLPNQYIGADWICADMQIGWCDNVVHDSNTMLNILGINHLHL